LVILIETMRFDLSLNLFQSHLDDDQSNLVQWTPKLPFLAGKASLYWSRDRQKKKIGEFFVI